MRKLFASGLAASSLLVLCSPALVAVEEPVLPAFNVQVSSGDDIPAKLPEAPVATVLASMSDAVRVFDQHVTTLSNPFMEGRLPGTYGMEVAKRYMEHYWALSGLEPAFERDGAPSWRQPFELGGTLSIRRQEFRLANGLSFTAGVDFNPQSLGGSGTVEGPIVFVGYSIDEGPDGYSSYAEDDSLKGKIALMLRFEPMNDAGTSLWGNQRWTNRAGFNNKVRGAAERGAAAIIIANPPGADDPRVNTLNPLGSGRAFAPCPVMHMSLEAASRMVASAGHDFMKLRRQADAGRSVQDLGIVGAVDIQLEKIPLIAENVGAMLPGRGSLANEIVVVGAHLDHIGMGAFGSRGGKGKLHPGADDNASGSAAILMIADRVAADYAKLPADANARSILFLAFSGEESGLNGSRYYAANPLAPIADHALMINFDMIGRITNKRLSVSGSGSGKGMKDWLAPMFEDSPLEIVQPASLAAASDHTSFYQKGIPVLFGIIANFHGDYHTPNDVAWKINRVDGVHAIDLFTKITHAAGTVADRFEFEQVKRNNRVAGSARAAGGGVRLGITSSAEVVAGGGVKINSVTKGGSAAEAGVKAGDILTKWSGKDVANTETLVGYLSKCKPGDKLQLTLNRDGKETTLWITLKGR